MRLLPGVGRAAIVGGVGLALAPAVGVSAIPLTLLAGALTPQKLISKDSEPGLKFASTTILRTGVVFVGFKLSLLELASIGMVGVPCVAASVAVGTFCIPRVARFFSLEPRLGSLITIGTSICGVTAISALAPAIRAKEEEVAVAVSNVVVYGALGMLLYPYLAHSAFGVDGGGAAGVFLGLAVHDTSQVMGAAASYAQLFDDSKVLAAAAVTKLTRNVCLAGVLPYLSMQAGVGGSAQQRLSLRAVYEHVPTFVLLFVGASLARSAGDYCLGTVAWWSELTRLLSSVAPSYLLAVAMGAVGLAIRPNTLTRYGAKPFLVGAIGALLVGTTGFASAYVVGSML